RKEAAELSLEIKRVQVLLAELVCKREELTKFIDDHLSLVSPVRRLPEDVAREIFIACMPDSPNSMSPQEPSLLLCHICRPWRRLALATPQLWASLDIIISKKSQSKELAERATCWLSRSGALPLSISL
ncbi:hypothetical protein B0H19DRAFT_891462, partial [Mycena capillaripes]